MKFRLFFMTIAIIGFISLNPLNANSQESNDCIKTFKVSGPGINGAKKEVFFTGIEKHRDFTLKEMLAENSFAERKYKGFDYDQIAKPSELMDCAGYVMNRIWKSGIFWIGADNFVTNVVRNFGVQISNVTGWDNARENDIVIYERNGKVNHVAYIRQADTVQGYARYIVIETKDGREGVYTHTLPDYVLREKKMLSTDPLIKKYGIPRIFRINSNLVSIEQIHPASCIEEINADKLNENWLGTWHRPGFTLNIAVNNNDIEITYAQDQESDGYRITKDPRIFDDVIFTGEYITGRWDSDPVFEDSFLNKTGKGSGTFELKLIRQGDSDKFLLSGKTIWDSEYCNGCMDTWTWERK